MVIISLAEKAHAADLAKARIAKGLKNRVLTLDYAIGQALAHGLICYAKELTLVQKREAAAQKRREAAQRLSVAAANALLASAPLTRSELARRAVALEAARESAPAMRMAA